MKTLISRFANGSWSPIVVVLPIFLVLVIVPLVVQIFLRSQWDSLHSSGIIAQGKIVNLAIKYDDSGSNYTVSYSYSFNGVDYTHTQDIAPSLYDRLQTSQLETILFAPDNPNNALLESTEAPSLNVPFYLFWYGSLVVVIILLFANNSPIRLRKDKSQGIHEVKG